MILKCKRYYKMNLNIAINKQNNTVKIILLLHFVYIDYFLKLESR